MMNSLDRRARIEELYGLLGLLSGRCGGPRLLADSGARSGWPLRGVYFFFEPGELREDGTGPRVVRVGTHALLTQSKATLWGRLAQHKGTPGGSRAGGGNHRGSIFRLHVGEALLARDNYLQAISTTWGRGGSAPAQVRDAELALERAVTDYIGAMSVLWLAVDDEPGPTSDRGTIEAGTISLLSNLERPPIDPASGTWLGRSAQRPVIRDSGLWNVRHVRDEPTGTFFPVLATWIERA